MDIISLYQDYNVDFKTEGHKHCLPGWVNIPCPFCEGNAGYHLGYHLETNHYVCWRCGFHRIEATISSILKLNFVETKKVVLRYGLSIFSPQIASIPLIKEVHRFPSGVVPLQDVHRRYLERRGFDPDLLERRWNLLGTGPVSLLKHINYKHRIMIPYFWNGEQVSFDSRDITNKSSSKYIACPKAFEKISHKEILYGNQERWNSRMGICVEGPTDVWRLGDQSFATSGIKYTPKQVRLIAKTFRRVAVMFDAGEPIAKEQGRLLTADLRFRGCDAFQVDIKSGDPGSLPQDEANYIVRNLLK